MLRRQCDFFKTKCSKYEIVTNGDANQEKWDTPVIETAGDLGLQSPNRKLSLVADGTSVTQSGDGRRTSLPV